MNHIKDLDKRSTARILIEAEKVRIDERLFNPVTCKNHVIAKRTEEMPSTPFIDALTKAATKVKCVPEMLEEKGIESAAGQLFDSELHKKKSH